MGTGLEIDQLLFTALSAYFEIVPSNSDSGKNNKNKSPKRVKYFRPDTCGPII